MTIPTPAAFLTAAIISLTALHTCNADTNRYCACIDTGGEIVAGADRKTYNTTMHDRAGNTPAQADRNSSTLFLSRQPPQCGDTFAVNYNPPQDAAKITVITGTPAGENRLQHGTLAVSPDGQNFTNIAPFVRGRAAAFYNGPVAAIKITVTEGQRQPPAIRRISIDKKQDICHPVDVKVEVIPEDLQQWQGILTCLIEDYYEILAETLLETNCPAPRAVTVTVRDSQGVAGTIGTHITYNSDWIRKHPDDCGVMIHELAHVIQNYPEYKPVWLIESLADYCRFVKFEGVDLRQRINAADSRPHDSYQKGAAFLTWLAENYGEKSIRKLSMALRRGDYSDELFKKITGVSLEELHRRYRAAAQAH